MTDQQATHPVAEQPVDKPTTKTSRAGRNLPAAIAVGVALGGMLIATLLFAPRVWVPIVAIAMAVATHEVVRRLIGEMVRDLLDETGAALYFSRLPIAGPEAPWVGLRHLGIYAYRVGWLERYVGAPPPPIERHERLEQLRALWMGARITVAVVDDPPAGGVDTEADLSRVRAAFAVTIGAPRH